MIQNIFRVALFLIAFLLVAVTPVRAASLEQISNWGASGVPTYIAMYIYVPDKLATNPPILVVSHYCTGSAAAMFSQAKNSGVVAAADQHGFIMIFPQNHLPGTTRNCWDVGSKASLTHDGGGDTQAIAQMVKYTITQYKANPNRVYATGSSSGAMMTQALLAVYPDVFKAGAEFSGVPAGCWADGYASSNQWSGNCAAGKTTFTAAQWGDKIRDMYPGYSGFRPRIQLWHGDSDEIINANNFTEAIKAWTNILSLDSTPTSSTTVTLSGKSWTRQSWQSACGFTVLDAWLEKGGAHNIDANLNAQYIIPFFGLDKADDVDPQVAMCSGDAGVVSTGGTGGSITGKDAGAGLDVGSGSASDTRGGADGPMAQGGSISSGGSQSSGGALGSGGNPTGGSIGGSGTGGIAASGGAIRNGGSVSVSGTGGATSSGGSLGTGGSSVKNSGSSSSGCALGGGTRRSQLGATMALVALALASCVWRRRQRIR